jgi:tRNA(Ile)-lysidine synthase
LKDREFLILSPIDFTGSNDKYYIQKDHSEVNIPLKLTLCKVADISIVSNKTIFVDADKIRYPLVLRRWNEEMFSTFGMNGKSKKVSKLLKMKNCLC